MSESPASASNQYTSNEYTAGFVTDIEHETIPPGLDESVIQQISAHKDEPQWLLDWRLQAFRR